MLDPAQNSEELLLRQIASSPAVSGSVLVLGQSPFFVEELQANDAVREITYVCGNRGDGGVRRGGKLRVFTETPPHGTKRRDIHRQGVDFLFCDLPCSPWERNRTAVVKRQVSEFRPRATAYRYMQLDIVAEWMGAGNNPEDICERAMGLFANTTGIWVQPRTDAFAAHCLDVAKAFMGKKA